MNPDTAPIAEIEAWLIERVSRVNWWVMNHGMYIRNTMDAAIACLPPGWEWSCNLTTWNARRWKCGLLFRTFAYRSNDPAKARDELLRLAAKAWQKMEEGK